MSAYAQRRKQKLGEEVIEVICAHKKTGLGRREGRKRDIPALLLAKKTKFPHKKSTWGGVNYKANSRF